MIKKPTKAHARRTGEKIHSDWRRQRHSVEIQPLEKPQRPISIDKGQITKGELKSVGFLDEDGKKLRDDAPVEAIFGIGVSHSKELRKEGIKTVADYRKLLQGTKTQVVQSVKWEADNDPRKGVPYLAVVKFEEGKLKRAFINDRQYGHKNVRASFSGFLPVGTILEAREETSWKNDWRHWYEVTDKGLESIESYTRKGEYPSLVRKLLDASKKKKVVDVSKLDFSEK